MILVAVEEIDQKLGMPTQRRGDSAQRGLRDVRLTREGGGQFAEQPRSPEAAAPDDDAVLSEA
jgi:hypothetical protein